MPITYKKKCSRCRKNYALTTSRNEYVICNECQKKELQGEIKDPKMKKLFDIPEDYYIKNSFLRNIKVNYLRYGNLTDRQVEAFKKTVKKMKNLTPSSPQTTP